MGSLSAMSAKPPIPAKTCKGDWIGLVSRRVSSTAASKPSSPGVIGSSSGQPLSISQWSTGKEQKGNASFNVINKILKRLAVNIVVTIVHIINQDVQPSSTAQELISVLINQIIPVNQVFFFTEIEDRCERMKRKSQEIWAVICLCTLRIEMNPHSNANLL